MEMAFISKPYHFHEEMYTVTWLSILKHPNLLCIKQIRSDFYIWLRCIHVVCPTYQRLVAARLIFLFTYFFYIFERCL